MLTSRSSIWLLLISCLLYGCSEKRNDNEGVMKFLDKSLDNSKRIVNKSTEWLLHELEEKTKDPATAVRGQKWFVKAQTIRVYSDKMCSQIENLKKKLITASINKNISLKSVSGSNWEIEDLKDNLINYNKNLLAIDPALNGGFSTYVSFDDDNGKSGLIFYPVHLLATNITVSEAIYLLNQFENNIRITENRMVQFSDNKVGTAGGFVSYSPIVSINTNRAEAGAKMEILAGVGAFSIECNPVVSIGGKLCDISEDGAVRYDFKAPQEPGKYHIPVKIEYTDEIGKRVTSERKIEYSVAR